MTSKRSSRLLLIALAALLLLAAAPGQAQTASKFDLRVKGGYGWSQVGDWNAFITHWFGYNRDYALAANWLFSGQMEEVHLGPELSLEALIPIGSGLKLGIEAGYLGVQKDGTGNWYTVSNQAGTGSVKRSEWTDIKAFPVRLTGYFTLPLGSSARIMAGAGAGLYYVKFNGQSHFDYENETWFRRETDTNALGYGFHGSLGLEIDLGKSFGIVLEALGRYAKISGFKGTLTWADNDEILGSEEGSLYYYEQEQLIWNTWVYLETTQPTGNNYRNVRKAVIDLTGATARAGLVFRF